MGKITELTGISQSSVYKLRKVALQRGYDPTKDFRILLSYVEDAPRSGRPVKAKEDAEKQAVEMD
jgi:hypothetical protein